MAGPNEPGGPGRNTTGGGDDQERSAPRADIQPKPRATVGRIPNLTPLKSVDSPPGAPRPAPGPAAFRPNVTAYWTPRTPVGGQGQSGFIRIATPVTTRPDGVVSIISASQLRPVGADSEVSSPSPNQPTVPGTSHGPPVAFVAVPTESPNKRRANTPVVTREGGVPVSAPRSAASYETPPFGMAASPTAGDLAASGVPVRAGEIRSGRIPFRVGDFEVATRIAQGGTGSIYVCRRVSGEQPRSLLALKVIRQHASEKEAVAVAFKREARVGTVFRHPNALTVLDVGVYENQPFLIFPYHEGCSLAALLAEGVCPPPSIVVTVLLDVLRGLQHAHRAVDEQGHRLGLVHADISPDNILVGTDGVSRLTDFGSARFTEQSAAGGSPGEGLGMGKPSHMSPEQLRGEPLDARSDIFAVGIVMWTALTGQKLFAADTYDQTIVRVMRRKIPPPSTLGAPACLDDLCLQALSRSPEGRFPTANAMADVLMDVAVKADLVATRERVAQWVRRDMGETLAERRRRIEQMFGDRQKTPGPTGTDEKGRSRPAGLRPGLQPAATIQLSRVEDALGTTKDEGLSRTMFIPSQGEVSRAARLTRRQWSVVTLVSVAVFFLTLAVGSWLSRATAHRAGPARTELPDPVVELPVGKTP